MPTGSPRRSARPPTAHPRPSAPRRRSARSARRSLQTTDRSALLLVAIGAAGAAISAYLTVAHYSGAGLVCTQAAGIDCDAVTSSSYSLVPGTQIPVSLAGLAWSLAVAAAGVVSRAADPAWLRPALLAWAVAGVAVALYLINAELTVIHAICEWCTALHVLIVLTLFIALARMREA